jgi:4Fe-4S ferredoxin
VSPRGSRGQPRLLRRSGRRQNAKGCVIIEVRMGTQPSSDTGCKAAAGEFAPVVDRAKCEGKAECVEVCPFHVFEVRRIEDSDFAGLGVLARLKSVAHGRKTAYTPLSSGCEACGKCVAACPEKAIKLARVQT